jgi:hypothetical protein
VQEQWQLGEVYSDHAISGATTLRPGYQKMLEAARAGRFDLLVAEALDRLSRDQENIAGLYKQLCFAGVRLVTLSEGEIRPVPEGPCAQDAARPGRSGSSGQVGRRALLRLRRGAQAGRLRRSPARRTSHQ